MRHYLLVLLILFLGLSPINGQRTVKGKVSDGQKPIEDVSVKIVGKEIATSTSENGSYEISVETGDILQFTYVGLKTISIQIEDVTRILNPVMIPDVTKLDEVVIKGSNRKSQKDLQAEYATNKRIIKTAYGYLDGDQSHGRIGFLDEKNINPVNICILDLLIGKFPGITVLGNCTYGGSVFIRGRGSISYATPAVYDVDGQIFTDAPLWLDIGNIKRLAVLGSLGLTVQYGFIGAGGVIVINTKAGNERSGKIVDQARLRNNFADGKELTQLQLAKNDPTYLKELQAAGSFEQARAIYKSNADKYNGSPYFFLDAYWHFYETRNQPEFADAILEEKFGLFENNAVLLKALAYHYESQGRFEKANAILKEVFILRPNYAQSYMDMANGYRNVGRMQEAASMYARYGYLLEEGFMQPDTVGFTPIINREFNNLFMLHKNDIVDGKQSKKLYVFDEAFRGSRLVFEWNDSEAEFELQFVNPMNQYYKWKHSLADNEDTVMAEKMHGYACTEYLIDDSLPGTWKVNVNYLGNKSLTPTYLKATIYHNYGTKSQQKEIKVFKLRVKNVNQELFSLQNNAGVVVR